MHLFPERLDAVMARFRSARPTCASVADFPLHDLLFGEETSFDIDHRSPSFLFPEGLSWLRAFRLPQSTDPFSVTIASYPVGSDLHHAYLFFPQVTVLDAAHATLRRSPPDEFRLEPASLSASHGIPRRLAGTMRFSVEKGERFLVIHTTDELLGGSTTAPTLRGAPVILPGAVGILPLEREEVRIPHSPAGSLRVRAEVNR